MSYRWILVLTAIAACSSTDPAQEKADASNRVLALLESGKQLTPSELFEVDSLTHKYDLRMAHGSTENFHSSAVEARLSAISKLLSPRNVDYDSLESARAHFDRVYAPMTAKQQTRLASLRQRFAERERRLETAAAASRPAATTRGSDIDWSKRVSWHDGWCSFSADGTNAYCQSQDGSEWERITPEGTMTSKNGHIRRSR